MLGGLAALGVMFAVVVSLVPTLAGTSRNPARVWADSAGLMARTLWGRRMQFLWNEIRLIEIHTEHTRATAASGPIKTVSVEMQTGRRRIAIFASSSESAARLVRVASLVAAIERYSHHRTLTFDREDSRRVAGARLDRVAKQLGASLVLVATAMTGVSEAFGTSDRTNFTISLVMMALVIGLGVWYIPRIGRPQAQKTSHGSTVSAIAMEPPWQPDPQALYEMTVGSYGLFRTTQGLCVVIGLSATAIGGGVALNGLSTDHSHVWWGALAALVGIVITVVSVRARDTVVIAQQGGLRKRWLLADTLIPWHDIASVTRRGTWYTVRARESGRRIGWPIVPFDSATQPQEPGAILLNPQQMAAVVEQRMGLTLQDERPL